jgi:hypothetical protein
MRIDPRTGRTLTRAFVFLLASGVQAEIIDNYPSRQALIINNCPYVELSGFSYANRTGSSGTRFTEELSWKNSGTQPLVAFEIVVLKYDAFNRRMLGTRWTVTGKNSADWRPLEAGDSGSDGTSSFGGEEVLTAIAYVRSARLADGTIWTTHDLDLLKELHRVAPGIRDFGDTKPDPRPKSAREN